MKITLEQWQTFKTVVDEGSFAKAADVLNKSQSSVSYIIAKLQEQLPVAVLQQQGRKAALTEAGKVLYRQANHLLQQASELEKSAQYLAKGWEAEVTIAADALVPIDLLLCGLQSFSKTSPITRIKLLETTLSGTDEALFTKQADIALTPRVPPGFIGRPLREVRMIPVASLDHPLSRQTEDVSEQDLRRHRQLVVRDSGIKRNQDAGWLAADQRWTVTYLSTSIEAIKAGLGFGFIPEHRIGNELKTQQLKKLTLSNGGERIIPLYLVLASPDNAGPAVKAVAEELSTHLTV